MKKEKIVEFELEIDDELYKKLEAIAETKGMTVEALASDIIKAMPLE